MIKQGFTFIELILALAISSLIGAALMLSFGQTQKGARIVERMIDTDVRILLMLNQFERDISGAFVPRYSLSKEKEKVFFSKQDAKKNVQELTFITCNPLQVYEDYKPRIVRVTYRLVAESDRGDSFKLLRKENKALAYDSKEKVAEYQLVSGIKSMQITYYVPEQEKEKKEMQAKKYTAFDTWGTDEEKRAKEKLSPLPQYVLVNLVLWDNAYERETIQELRFQIYAFEVKKEEKRELPQQEVPRSEPPPTPRGEVTVQQTQEERRSNSIFARLRKV